MLNFLSENLAIVALLLVTLLVLALLALILSAARRGGGATAATESKLKLLGSESLRLSFRKAVEMIEENLAVRGERYSLSWTLLLDEGGERGLPLDQCGLPSALSADGTLDAAAQGIVWHFFDRGVVVQLRSDRLGESDPDSATSSGAWDDFLGLCRAYRPQRPFDSIVLALPCAALLGDDAQSQLDLVARAKAIHRRLWLAQNRLALRFPIYLVVSSCDVLPGFAAFGGAMPEPLRRSMLGWSAPYELVAPYRDGWADSALDEIVRTAAERGAELSALEPAGQDSASYFMLPSELDRLRAGLKLFCAELMRPSAYHEPFLLRGIYLSGDASDSAALVAEIRQAQRAPAPGEHLPAAALVQVDGQAEASAAVPPAAPAGAAVDAMRLPVFLRDVFERKVFAEAGLVQSSSQRMRRPAASRVGHALVLALPVLWAIGLVAASIRLQELGGELSTYLAALEADARSSQREGATGTAQRSQRRVADALRNIERLARAGFGSPFMPGSWSVFDDLHGRVLARLEQGFAENAFDPLRRAAIGQVSQLTGASLDPASGAAGAGPACRLPAGWSEQAGMLAGAALDLEELPQFAALQGYLARVDELGRVVGAMARLRRPDTGPASAEDLALVVRVLLGAELEGNPARTAALFRRVARREPPLPLGPMQEAARCALRLGGQAMYARLFDDNGLLRSETAVATASAALATGAQPGTPLPERLQAWQALYAGLEAQRALAGNGKGRWMRRTTLELGSGHEAMLARVGANELLGKAAMRDLRQRANEGFARFSLAWREVHPAGADAGNGLVWTDAGWSFAPARKDLHEALGLTLAQPWMKPAAPTSFPTIVQGETVSWDRGLLEQTLHLAEARKLFQAGPYGRFPPPLQPAVRELADLALAQAAHGQLAHAASVALVELPSGASDDARAVVLRIRGWLQEIGAGRVLAELDGVLVRDSLTRLQRLDDLLTAAEVYTPRDAGFLQWKGNKGALAEAFGNGDPVALAAYMAQQQEFVDTVASQADSVLTQLTRQGARSPLLERWKGIVEDLKRYRLKSPASSLAALEQFILVDSAGIDIGNCATKLKAPAGRPRGSDVFAQRLQQLQAGMLARCRALSANGYHAEWDRFAELYNRDLGRRAPFAFQSGAVPADRDTVEAAMKQYDRARSAATLAEQEAAAPDTLRVAADQLQPMRDLLAPLFPADAAQPAGLDLAVQFRAAGPGENAANQIIDWSLSVGGATLRRNDPPRTLTWEPGMPVALSLRLANDGGSMPKLEPGQGAMTVADRTVSYRYEGPWALFNFVGAHRGGTGADQRSPLLRFEFPLERSGAGGALQGPARARVFLRLTVSPAGKRLALAWPASALPARLPAWQDATLNTADAAPPFNLEAASR